MGRLRWLTVLHKLSIGPELDLPDLMIKTLARQRRTARESVRSE